ncbi:MAG: metalloregulator ArsR/SmtB family transcription factor [Acidobacteria bacterium]|nr:metalloregulator ArsR/SmtB family transcription factor [Acidobacteriota bacterium]
MNDSCRPFDVESAAEMLRALAEPNRLRLIAGMTSDDTGGAPVGSLAECCSIDLSVVSRHLKALREAGLVSSEKLGREVRYCCNRNEVVGLLRDLADWIENCCPGLEAAEKGEGT